MRQLVLHVGSIKTGSTSAQTTFAASRERLAAHGVHYASISRNHGAVSRVIRATRRNGFPGEADLAGVRAQEASDFTLMERAAAEAAAVKSGTYMFSSEALLTHSARNVALLKSIVDRLFPDFAVSVLVYIRHPLSYTISRGQNEIKLGTDTTALIEERGYDGELRVGVERYAEVFGRDAMIVRSYDAVIADGRSVQEDMLEAIGHPGAAEGLVIERSNESISMNAALVADIVNPALAERGIRVDANVRRAKKQLLSEIAGPRFAFSRAALDAVRGPCRTEAAWFAEAYGLALSEPKVVVREDIADKLMPADEIADHADRVLERISAVRQAVAKRKAKKARGRKPRREQKKEPDPSGNFFAKLIKRFRFSR